MTIAKVGEIKSQFTYQLNAKTKGVALELGRESQSIDKDNTNDRVIL